jgi:hypothetical protein
MDLIVMTIVLTEMITVLIVMTNSVLIVMNIKQWQLIHQGEILLSLKKKSKAWQITLNPNIIKVKKYYLTSPYLQYNIFRAI